MKTYKIQGELEVYDDLTHQEMIHKLFTIFSAYNLKFRGETKEVTDEKEVLKVDKFGRVHIDWENPKHVEIYKRWTED